MKIYVAHGAFDTKVNRRCGMSVLAGRLRYENSSHEVIELESQEIPEDLLARIWIGYSNGFNLVLDQVQLLNTSDPTVVVHVCSIDGVRYGGGFMTAPWFLPRNVQTSLCFLRTQLVGAPPYHQIIANPRGPVFPIHANHGSISSALEVHDLVSQWVSELLQ